MLFGRSEQKGPMDPASVKCLALTHELHDWFRENNTKKVACCRILTCAAKTAELAARELGIPTTGEIKVLTYEEYLKTPVAPQTA